MFSSLPPFSLYFFFSLLFSPLLLFLSIISFRLLQPSSVCTTAIVLFLCFPFLPPFSTLSCSLHFLPILSLSPFSHFLFSLPLRKSLFSLSFLHFFPSFSMIFLVSVSLCYTLYFSFCIFLSVQFLVFSVFCKGTSV